MTAQVQEVKAYSSIDGEVFSTYIKAHHRNIYVLTHKLFGITDDVPDDYKDYKEAAMLIYQLIKGDNKKAKEAILELAKELS